MWQGNISVGSGGGGTQTSPVFEVDNGFGQEVQTCRIDYTANQTGGTGTIDVYVQDSYNGTNWTDRVHFPTLTGVAQGFWWVTLDARLDQTPLATHTYTDASLAANTAVNGAISKWMRAKIVFTAASTSTETLSVNCK